MSKHNIVVIVIDTHKSFIDVAYIEDVRGVKSIQLGNIIVDVTWKAQLRLCPRYQTMLRRDKPFNVIVTAIVR